MEQNKDLFDFESNDIYSSSSAQTIDIMSSSKNGRHYKKKPRGNKITLWWKKLRKKEKALLISVASLVLVLCIVAGVLFKMFDYNYNAITSNPEDLGFENVIDEKIINIALFGIDARDPKSFKGLSDSIMIMSLNTETKKIKLISIMRDSLVPITYNGKKTYAKINSAYNKGGPELAIKTINTIFGLDISEYATVNFYGMADIIDAVGGIDVTLTEKELNVYGYENGRKVNWGINGLIMEQCAYMGLDYNDYKMTKWGNQHLNGVQAVAYARIRKAANADGTNDDFGRTDRQRYVMEQLFNKALTIGKSQYLKLAKALIPCSETSLSLSEIMGLAFDILLDSPKFEQSRVPLKEYQIGSKTVSGSGSCVYYDLDYAKDLIHAFIYDETTPEAYMEANGIRKNDWYKGGSSSTSSKKPSSTTSSSSGKDNSKDEETSSSEITDSSVTESGDDSSNVTSTDPEDTSGSESGSDSSSGSESSSDNSSGTDSSEASSTNSNSTPTVETGSQTPKSRKRE